MTRSLARSRARARTVAPSEAQAGSTHRARGHAMLLLACGLAVVSLSAAAVVTVSSRSDPIALATAARGDAIERVIRAKAIESGADAEIDFAKQRRVLAALAQAGLDAQSLAASGITPQQATTIGTAMAEAVETLVADVEHANDAALVLEQQVGELERLVVAGQAMQEQVTELATKRGQLATARTARSEALDAVWEEATAGLSPEVIGRLGQMHATCHSTLPTRLRAIVCEPGEAMQLENAYTHVRVAQQLEMDPDQAAATIVSDAETEPAATAAAGWLASNLEQVAANLAAAAGQ